MIKNQDISGYLNKLSIKYRNKNLDDIEVRIVSMLLEDRISVEDIAERVQYSEKYTGQKIRELCGLVAQETKINVSKLNLVSTIQSILNSVPEHLNEFNSIHGLNKRKVETFNKNHIIVDMGSFWKYDAINQRLILKSQYPIIVNLKSLTLETLGKELILISQRDSLKSPYALEELLQILSRYLDEDMT